MIARAIVAALVFLIALLTYPGALAVSLATRFTPAPAASPGPDGALPWLHVAHPPGDMPYIADDDARGRVAKHFGGLGSPVLWAELVRRQLERIEVAQFAGVRNDLPLQSL